MAGRAMIAMSGGVDSSVAAALMLEAGYDCAGAMMKLYEKADGGGGERSCCTADDAEDARQAACALGIPFYVFNFREEFEREVIGRFVRTYEEGGTPNPCIDCNRYMKHRMLFEWAAILGFDTLVTGHYARIERGADGRWLLKKAKNSRKDQSYVLYFLSQEQLARTSFPLGGFSDKDEIRAIAEKHGFRNARKRESQDICFVDDGKYGDFLEKYTGRVFPPGDFVDEEGRVLGRHRGITRYTIGQRKGLGLSLNQPMYVCRKDVGRNEVTLTKGPALYSDALLADHFNWIACDPPKDPLRVTAKTRYRAKESPATVRAQEDGSVLVCFDHPERAVAKGQAVVLYDGDVVVGGGTIQ